MPRPSIPMPTGDVAGLFTAVSALKEVVEQLVGVRGTDSERALTATEHQLALATGDAQRLYSDTTHTTLYIASTAYTPTRADQGKLIEMYDLGANTLTIPPQSEQLFPLGAWFDVVQVGPGVTTIAAGSGVTLRSRSSYVDCSARWARVQLYHRLPDIWVLSGDLA